MIRSKFRAYNAAGECIFRATAAGKTFETHDMVVDAYINHSRKIGAVRFEVIGK